MKKNNTWGIWVRENKTFYYLYSGIHSVSDPTGRTLNRLLANGTLQLEPGRVYANEEPYKLMTLAQAEEKRYTVEVMFLNDFAKAHFEEKQEATKLNGWR